MIEPIILIKHSVNAIAGATVKDDGIATLNYGKDIDWNFYQNFKCLRLNGFLRSYKMPVGKKNYENAAYLCCMCTKVYMSMSCKTVCLKKQIKR